MKTAQEILETYLADPDYNPKKSIGLGFAVLKKELNWFPLGSYGILHTFSPETHFFKVQLYCQGEWYGLEHTDFEKFEEYFDYVLFPAYFLDIINKSK